MASRLDQLERRFGWLAVPQISILLVTLQVAGFLLVGTDPVWGGRLALLPGAVLEGGEYWRLITFLALPLSLSPIWVIFSLWFLYFIVNAIESQWGPFKTTLYVLVSILVTIGFSLATGYPVTQASHFESTLFLAAALLYPEMEIRLFFLLPVKMKWMAVVTAVFVGIEAIRGNWMDRLYLAAIYSNCLLFFGPAMWESVRLAIRRAKYKGKLR